MKRYLHRSNNIPTAVPGWKSPDPEQDMRVIVYRSIIFLTVTAILHVQIAFLRNIVSNITKKIVFYYLQNGFYGL